MLRITTRTSLLFLLSVTAGLLVLSAPALGCMSNNPCAGCPSCCNTNGTSTTCGCHGFIDFYAGPRTMVEPLGQGKIQVTIQGYDTTQLQPFTDCVTAFPPLDSVASVDAVVNYDGRTNQPFTEVSFYRSETPAATIAEFAQGEGMAANDRPWHAFQSHITGTVEDGVPNYFVVELTLHEGVDLLTFLEELKAAGSFLTSGSDAVGTPNHHPYFRDFSAVPLTVKLPFAIGQQSPQLPGGDLTPLDR